MEEQIDHLSEADLRLDREETIHLVDTAKWTKFIGITYFVMAGLCLLVGLAASTYMSEIFRRLPMFGSFGGGGSAAVFIAIIVIMVALISLLAYYLVNFSGKITMGFNSQNTDQLNQGLGSLKNYFIVTAIVGAIGLLFTLIGMVATN